MLFTGGQQTVDPGQEFLGAVIGMQDDRNAVQFGNVVYVQGTRNRSGNGTLLLIVGQAFTSVENTTAVRKLNNNRRIDCFCRFQNSIDRVGTDDVDRRQRVIVFVGVTEQVGNAFTGYDAGGGYPS